MKITLLLALIVILTLSGKNKIENNTVEVTEGSILISFVTQDTIWLAADTKILHVNINNQTTGITNQTKIYQAGDVFFGFTGLSTINYGYVHVDLAKIVQGIAKKHKELTALFKLSNDSIQKELIKYINFQKMIPGNLLLNRWLNSATMYEIMMVGFDNGKPNFMTESYALKFIANDFKIITTYSNQYDKKVRILLAGHRNDVRAFIYKNENYLQPKSPNIKEKLVCLVKLQSQKDPEVGMPADVVTIYNKGFKWSLGNKDCLLP